MAAVLIGVLLVALKLFEVNPVFGWSWPAVLSPFGAAILWWAWSDLSGRTSKVAMQKMDDRRTERRKKHLVSLGLDPKLHDEERKRAEAHRKAREREAERVEGKREAQRDRVRQSILASRMDTRAADTAAATEGDPSSEPTTRPAAKPAAGQGQG